MSTEFLITIISIIVVIGLILGLGFVTNRPKSLGEINSPQQG